MDNDLTLKEVALKPGLITEEEFDRVGDPAKLISPCSQERRSSRAAALER
jgi:fumarate hydratase class II